jgi:hypothetical protein
MKSATYSGALDALLVPLGFVRQRSASGRPNSKWLRTKDDCLDVIELDRRPQRPLSATAYFKDLATERFIMSAFPQGGSLGYPYHGYAGGGPEGRADWTSPTDGIENMLYSIGVGMVPQLDALRDLDRQVEAFLGGWNMNIHLFGVVALYRKGDRKGACERLVTPDAERWPSYREKIEAVGRAMGCGR